MMRTLLKFFAVLLFSMPLFLQGAELSLDDFLHQVKTQGPDYARAQTNEQITIQNREAIGRHWSAGLSLSGNLNAYNEYDYSYNGATNSYNSFDQYFFYSAGSRASLNFSNTWDFGLQTSLSYSANVNRDWYGNNPYGWLPNGGYPYDSFNLSVGIPLWQNFLGAATHAGDQASFKSNDAQQDFNAFNLPGVIYQAKLTYYALAQARAVLDFQTQALQEYQKLLNDSGPRLVPLERTQLQTALDNATLALESAKDQERLARDNFNRLRGKTGSEVESILSLEESLSSSNTAWPGSEPDRLDLQSSKLYLESSRYSLQVAEENTKLNLFLNGSVGGDIFSGFGNLPAPPPVTAPLVTNYSVGLNLNVPFDIFTDLWDLNLRNQRLSLSQQEKDVTQTQDSDHRQWEDMTLRFQDSGERLDKADAVERGCKQKVEQGETQFKRGKTDAFEMVGFVGQYLAARSNRLYWIDQRLSLSAEAEWFQATKSGDKTPEAPKP